jgi:hypothetical protein
LLGRIVFEETPQRSGLGKILSLIGLTALILGLVAISVGEAVRRRAPGRNTP